ncbi:hypothetical protein ACU686_39995 [Yinghuangia aomiensis]
MNPAEAAQSLTQAAEFARGTPAERPVAGERARQALAAGDEAAALAALGEQGPEQPRRSAPATRRRTALTRGAADRGVRAHAACAAPGRVAARAVADRAGHRAVRAGRCPVRGRVAPACRHLAAMLYDPDYWADLAHRTGRLADPQRIASARDFHRERISRLIVARGADNRDFRLLATTWRLECAFVERAEPLRWPSPATGPVSRR